LEVRKEAFSTDVPTEYPIPINKRIQKYKEKNLEGCNNWWAFSKYFPKEYRNPGENLDFLFDRKEELFNAMDGAVNEMESLLSSIK
jgi:hypothetical protein